MEADQSHPAVTRRPGLGPWNMALGLVAVGSAVLRILLVMRGGQYFWADESRYHAARESWALLSQGNYSLFYQKLFEGADHLLFKVIMLLSAAVADWTRLDPLAPALFCAAFSVVNMVLVARIARTAGASPREAFVAALLLACANSQFYYAQFLLPYDAALTFCLLALLVGWPGDGPGRSFVCGLWAGLAFLTYNGYWLLGAVGMPDMCCTRGSTRDECCSVRDWPGRA